MKRISIRITIAFATFLTGVGIAAFWLVNRSRPVAEIPQNTPDCVPQYEASVSPNDYGGTDKANVFARFRELPLDKQPACVDESYRLTWIPTFHVPTVIRVWRSGEKSFIVTKRLDNKGGYGMGNFNGETFRSLTDEEWSGFVNLLNEEFFWSMPSKIEEPLPNDGAAWMFEGTNGGQYHFVFRIMPSNKLSNIFRSLFKLTGVETEHEGYLPQNEEPDDEERAAFKVLKPTIREWLRGGRIKNEFTEASNESVKEILGKDKSRLTEDEASWISFFNFEPLLIDVNGDGRNELAIRNNCAPVGNCQLWLF